MNKTLNKDKTNERQKRVCSMQNQMVKERFELLSRFLNRNKEIYKYKVLEPIKIEFKSEIDRSPKDAKRVAESDKYVFYAYKTGMDGSGGYLLRQEKKSPKRIVFFGECYKQCICYKGHLFMCNMSGESGRFAIKSRNIETGEMYVYNSWLGKHSIYFVINGYGRFWCQDSIKDVSVVNDSLVFHITRKESNENESPIKDKSISYDEYDADMEYELIIHSNNGSFVPEYRYHFLENNNLCWRNNQGKIRCRGDSCKQNCDDRCPIYLNTLGLELIQSEEYEEAILVYKKALDIAPDFSDVWNNMAMCYASLNEFGKAYENYKEAFSLKPKDKYLIGMALSARDGEKYDLALKHCSQYKQMYFDGALDNVEHDILIKLSLGLIKFKSDNDNNTF